MADPIKDIKGMTEEMAGKLAGAGIKNTADLVAYLPHAKRADLATQLGIAVSEVTEMVNRADLMRLNGVGTEYANLLEECGVDSCKELQHRVPANLQAKMASVNEEKKITRRVPTLAQVETWIGEAKEFAKSA